MTAADKPASEKTLREHYAGLFAAALLSNLADIRRDGFRDAEIEEFAIMRADALLAELERARER